MAEQNAVKQMTPSPRMGEVLLSGKVIEVRRYQKGRGEVSYFTVMIMPAVDQYTPPPVVEVRSSQQWAGEGEEVRCVALVGGYRQSYNAQDERTGDRERRYTTRLTLNLVTPL